MSSRDSLLNRIAIELNDPEQIHEKIQAQKRTRSKLETAFVAPRTPTEKAVAEIWAELLGLDQVGIQDDFFELGGHSLLAIQVLSRVRQVFEVELSHTALFANTITLANVARVIEQELIDQASEEEISAILKELEELSDDEVRALLAA